jgi:hypothetical protein
MSPEGCRFYPHRSNDSSFDNRFNRGSGLLRARKRSQAARILDDLRLIDGAIDQYALETSRKAGDPVAVVDWTAHIKKDTLLYSSGQDLFGNNYGSQTVDAPPQVPSNALRSLSDVTEPGFWSPFGP